MEFLGKSCPTLLLILIFAIQSCITSPLSMAPGQEHNNSMYSNDDDEIQAPLLPAKKDFKGMQIHVAFEPRSAYNHSNETFYYKNGMEIIQGFPPSPYYKAQRLLHNHVFAYCVDFLNFTVIASTVEQNDYREVAMQLVSSREADFSIGINTLNASMANEFRFLHPIDFHKTEIYFTADAKYSSSGLYTSVFTWQTWTALGIVFLLFGIFFGFAWKGSISETGLLIVSNISQQGFDTEDQSSWKYSFGLILLDLFTLVMYSAFSAVLINSLAFNRANIENLDDLLRLGFKFKYHHDLQQLNKETPFHPGTPFYKLLLNLHPDPPVILLNGEFVKNVLQRGKRVATVTPWDVYEALGDELTIAQKCGRLGKIPMPGRFDTGGGFALRGSPFVPLLNLALISMFETGIYKRNYRIHWRYKDDYAPHCPKDPPLRPLPFETVKYPCIILTLFYAMNILVLMIERTYINK